LPYLSYDRFLPPKWFWDINDFLLDATSELERLESESSDGTDESQLLEEDETGNETSDGDDTDADDIIVDEAMGSEEELLCEMSLWAVTNKYNVSKYFSIVYQAQT